MKPILRTSYMRLSRVGPRGNRRVLVQQISECGRYCKVTVGSGHIEHDCLVADLKPETS